MRIHKDDFADYLSSVQKEWFLKRKLKSQRIIVPEHYTGSRVTVWRINWGRVGELYSEYPVAKYAKDLATLSEEDLRQRAHSLLKQIKEAKREEVTA